MKTAHHNRIGYAISLGLLAALGPLCIDLYLPALPELATDLNTPTSTAQLSLTAGLLGLGFGQLLFGPLSDKMGRLRPLTLSLVMLIIASVGCAWSQTIHQLLLARLFESGGRWRRRAVACHRPRYVQRARSDALFRHADAGERSGTDCRAGDGWCADGLP